MLELVLESRRATRELASALAAHLAVGDVVWLEGPLGAGKTFFARGLLRALGVPSAVPVTSPTFGLVHEHAGRIPIRHLDLYRLGDATELAELGLDEAMEEALLVVEWGARLRGAIHEDGLEVTLAPGVTDHARGAVLRGVGARGRALIEALSVDPRVARRTLRGRGP